MSKQLIEIFSSKSDPRGTVESLLSKLRTFIELKHWHEFEEGLLSLVFEHQYKDLVSLLECVFSELSTFLDPVIQIELLGVMLEKSTQDDSAKMRAISKLKEALPKTDLISAFLIIQEVRTLFISKDFEKGFEKLLQAEEIVESHRSVPKTIFNALYSCKLIYFWQREDFSRYSSCFSQFLAYINISRFTPEQQVHLAEQSLQASLLASEVMIFSHLLDHSFLDHISKNQHNQDLLHLVHCFSRGEIDQVNSLLEDNSVIFKKYPLLLKQQKQLRRKIQIITLYNTVFYSQTEGQGFQVSFRQIAKASQVDLEEVEKLVILSFSIGLFVGKIDQENDIVNIQSVRPQEIDIKRLPLLKEKFVNWKNTIERTLETIASM